MTVYTVRQARAQLSRLIAEAADGQEVVIARGRTPVARLTPIAQPERARSPGRLKGVIQVDDRVFEPLPPADLALWEGGED